MVIPRAQPSSHQRDRDNIDAAFAFALVVLALGDDFDLLIQGNHHTDAERAHTFRRVLRVCSELWDNGYQGPDCIGTFDGVTGPVAARIIERMESDPAAEKGIMRMCRRFLRAERLVPRLTDGRAEELAIRRGRITNPNWPVPGPDSYGFEFPSADVERLDGYFKEVYSEKITKLVPQAPAFLTALAADDPGEWE